VCTYSRSREWRRAFKGYGHCALYCGSRLAGSKQGGGDIILRSNFVRWNSRADGTGRFDRIAGMPMGNEGESSQVVGMLIKYCTGKRRQMRVLKVSCLCQICILRMESWEERGSRAWAEGYARNESCVCDESRTEVSARVSIVCIARRSRYEVEEDRHRYLGFGGRGLGTPVVS